MLVTFSQLKTVFSAENIDWWGSVALETPPTISHYEKWIEKSYHGEMAYLKDHLPAKKNPKTIHSKMKTGLFVAINYRPHPFAVSNWPLKAMPVASYALGTDYHFGIKTKLQEVIDRLAQQFKGESFLAMTDSHPVLERDFANRAGLGWFGKNTCLLHKDRGSFFFIAEIFTSLEVDKTFDKAHNMCGTCDRCITACPTGALVRPYELDATRCISYWTIEARENPPIDIRKRTGQWFFGCDICQQVCPWNEKIYGKALLEQELKYQPSHEDLLSDLRLILESSNKELMRLFHGTAVTRTGGRGLKRNAMMCAVHYQIKEAIPFIEKAIENQNNSLFEIGQWAIRELSQPTETKG